MLECCASELSVLGCIPSSVNDAFLRVLLECTVPVLYYSIAVAVVAAEDAAVVMDDESLGFCHGSLILGQCEDFTVITVLPYSTNYVWVIILH